MVVGLNGWDGAMGRSFLIATLVASLLHFGGCYQVPEGGTLSDGPEKPREKPIGLSLRLNPEDLPPQQDGLRFLVSPFLGSGVAEPQYRPLATYLEEALGVPVTFEVGTSYRDVIDRVAMGKFDVAILPPASYVLAKERHSDLRLLASQLAYGATSYSSYIFVRTEDPSRSLKDLVGRRMAFVDEHSTSGFFLPYAAFLREGIDPRTAFDKTVFSRDHTSAIRDLIEGRVDAAATASGMLDATRNIAKDGESLDRGSIRILYKAGRIPYDALVSHGALPKSGADKIAWVFIGLNTRSAKGREVYASTEKISGWRSARDVDYDGVRRVLARVREHRGRAGGGLSE
jgi:phosphonate transport system substrate-binding protein